MNDSSLITLLSVIISALITAIGTVIAAYIGKEKKAEPQKITIIKPPGYESRLAESKTKSFWNKKSIVIILVSLITIAFTTRTLLLGEYAKFPSNISTPTVDFSQMETQLANTTPTISVTIVSDILKNCVYTINNSYADELAILINSTRQQMDLPVLTISMQLNIIAQNQSIYMVCLGTVTHYGPDGSTPNQRILAAGYVPIENSESIFGGGNAFPQNVLDSWMSDEAHRSTFLSLNADEMGVGCVCTSDANSNYCYYTIDVDSR